MKKYIVALSFLLCIALTGCGTTDVQSDGDKAILRTTFSPGITTNTIATIENKMLYQTIDMASSTFYVLDLLEEKTTEIATISDYVMDSGSTVIIEDLVYTYITVSNDGGKTRNELYRISCSDLSMEMLSVDQECAPLVSLYKVPNGILALKVSNSRTYFELINTTNGTSDIVLEAPQDETFVTATVSNNTLFVFAYSGDSNSGYDYFIRKYTLDGFSEGGIIFLDNIEQYISQARIGEMAVLNNYLFLNNYSNVGLIASINEDNSVSSSHEVANIAYLTSNVEDNTALFYIRQSSTYYVFDMLNGDLQQMELTLDRGYNIRSMFADKENIVVKAKTSRESKTDTYDEEIYVFTYNDLTSLNIEP